MVLRRGKWLDLRISYLGHKSHTLQVINNHGFPDVPPKETQSNDLHHEMTLGDGSNINQTVQRQSISAAIRAVQGGGDCCFIPVGIAHPFLIGHIRSGEC